MLKASIAVVRLLQQRHALVFMSFNTSKSSTFFLDTWILFRGYAAGVSKLILDAYHNYEIMEFGRKHKRKPITDVDRHIKLISIAGEKVNRLILVK